MGTGDHRPQSGLQGPFRGLRVALTSGTIIVLFTVGLMGTEEMDILAQSLGFSRAQVEPPPTPATSHGDDPGPGLTLRDFEHHPDIVHARYFTARSDDSATEAAHTEVAGAFRELLSMYEFRQAVDDNFTARAYDVESGEVLAVTALESDREQYSQTGSAHWGSVDHKRRRMTRQLVDRLVEDGYLRDDIRVRWGRKNQVLEARTREYGYLEHEIRLARYLGLSLLATEIGTVETFNDDRLVSRVGARSRYQLMPAMLRARGVHHYRLRTRAGTQIDVREEWHPLITMQAAFLVARAYSNAVGHEIPGLSAYHTGPYNIFRVYRQYLTSKGGQFESATGVVNGYLWALTEGFEQVSSTSSFKNYSRGYIPTLYASLRAAEDLVIDTTATVFVEQLQLRSGESMFLSELLHNIDGADERLHWRSAADGSLYERFRQLNPHFNIPRASEAGTLPETGDVFLVATPASEEMPVRFFLPSGAAAELRSRGVEAIDYDAVVRYDRHTFDIVDEPLTIWDQLYADLVEDVQTFGFTFENRARLQQVVRHLEEAAAASPSLYRRTLRDVARLHERVWASDHFARLARVVPAARGRQRLPAQPPDIVANTPQDEFRPATTP